MTRPQYFYGHVFAVMKDEHPPVLIAVVTAAAPEVGFQTQKLRIKGAGVLQKTLPADGYTTDKVPCDVKTAPCKAFSHGLGPEFLQIDG